MSTILITGGTGLIGRRLVQMMVSGGHKIIILSRHPYSGLQIKGISYAQWDIEAKSIDERVIGVADHIIHLAGAGVADERWTVKRKQAIVNSRTQSSALLVKALTDLPNHVRSVISASAIGWYGADTAPMIHTGFTEDALPDNSFLGATCRLWEESIRPVEQLGIRLVTLRTGIVLCREGGALREFIKPLHARIAAILGDGRQVISWIEMEDLCRIYMKAVTDETMRGVYNAVAPNPVTNEELTCTLARKMYGNSYVPVHVPALLLKLLLGEMSIEVLKSTTVDCSRLRANGFTFLYPTIGQAISRLVQAG